MGGASSAREDGLIMAQGEGIRREVDYKVPWLLGASNPEGIVDHVL